LGGRKKERCAELGREKLGYVGDLPLRLKRS
jgi:hypothetical protein